MHLSRPFEPRRRELVLSVLALLGGCGGGVDSGGTGTGASSTYASGPITGFGSIIVNNVRYDDSFARIEDDDGSVCTRADLRLGMRTEVIASTVTAIGGVLSATASSIRVRSDIVGPLESVDLLNARLTVLGQTVAIVATTVFDSSIAGVASLRPGDVLEIYATLDVAAGRYVASRIDRRAGVAAYKLYGAVGVLALSARTITLGQLTIDWSAVAPADPATALAPGRLVRVRVSPSPTAGVWQAITLAAAQTVQSDREFAEVEGRITAFTSATHFAVEGLTVDASLASLPAGGAGLALGVKVEVRGNISNGVLVASRVTLESEDGGSEPYELHGSIESITSAQMRFVVRAVTVVWSAATRFEGGTPGDLAVGRKVEVRGRLSSDGSLIEATLVHIEQ